MKRSRPTTIRITTNAGDVEIETFYGQDPVTNEWLNPMRELWALQSRQVMSPVLEDRLCYTATLTGSYEAAAKVAVKWGAQADDSTIHAHVRSAGARAETLREERVERALDPDTRAEVVAESAADLPQSGFSLVIMLDGWMIRERGADWGLKPPEKEADRVEWREMKSGIVFRLEDRGETDSGRRFILNKFYEAHRGEPFYFGRYLYAEALRRGLNQAERVYVVADGAVWIWRLVEDRFSDAVGVLDFYHASEHLWAVAREISGGSEEDARAWVEPLLSELKHGGELRVLESLEEVLDLCDSLVESSAGAVRTDVRYFQSHREHLHYETVAAHGCPRGSGAMESTCSQFQDRFKRTGQFWSSPGEKHLLLLELARRNDDWDDIWEESLVA